MENKRNQLSIKVLHFWFLGNKYIGCNLSLGQFSWGTVYLGATSHPKGSFPQGQFPGGYCQGAIFPGGNCPRANYHRGNNARATIQGEVVRGAVNRMAIFHGGNFPDTIITPDGNCARIILEVFVDVFCWFVDFLF